MNKAKTLPYAIGTLLTLIGLSAVVAGGGLVWYPEGGMGLSVDLLKNSPFNDFFIPGLFLLVVNGIASLTVAVLAFRKHRIAGISTLLLGAFMILWILLQVYWMGWTSWLQPTLFVVGVVEMSLGVILNEMYTDNHKLFKGHHGTMAH